MAATPDRFSDATQPRPIRRAAQSSLRRRGVEQRTARARPIVILPRRATGLVQGLRGGRASCRPQNLDQMPASGDVRLETGFAIAGKRFVKLETSLLVLARLLDRAELGIGAGSQGPGR